jgi:hypothetical protein
MKMFKHFKEDWIFGLTQIILVIRESVKFEGYSETKWHTKKGYF